MQIVHSEIFCSFYGLASYVATTKVFQKIFNETFLVYTEMADSGLGSDPGLLRYLFQTMQEGFLPNNDHFLLSISLVTCMVHLNIQVACQ